jgi:DNA-binding YbaB/EbfC family protein
MKNLGNLMKQAQQMQAKMGEMQAELGTMEIDGAAGGGMVKVVVNGKGDLRRLKIDPSLCTPDEVEVLEDLIVAACNDARAKAEDLAQSKMAQLTSGLPLPPGMKLPF